MSANKKRKPRGKTISTEHLSQEEREAHEKRLLYQREYQRRRYQERKNQPKDKESKFGQKKSDESNQKSCPKRKSPANSAAKLNETRLERLERLERRALNMKKKNRPYREKLRRLIEQEQKLVALVNDKLTEYNNEDADKTEDEVDSLINQSTESCQDETKDDDEIDDIDKKDDIQLTNESNDIKEHCQEEEEVSKDSGKNFDDIIDLDTEPEVVVNNNFSDSFPKFFNINHRKFKPQHWIVPSKSIDVIELDCDTETPNLKTTTTSNPIELIDLDSDSDRPEEEEEEEKNKSSNCSRVSVISFASNDSGFNDFKEEESPEAATSNSNPQQPFWTKKFWLLKHNLETSREADQDQEFN